jgi:hypothetical protein
MERAAMVVARRGLSETQPKPQLRNRTRLVRDLEKIHFDVVV